ncbi:hypothetical protein SAMN05660776_2602 [Salegentibacter holothuriorum]|uniref:DUF4190 domain-containing protein n=1 Tax=Salegentibacter holothuriorum TaxID=241145 RepID=A0A1T5DG07_9FLAO|nr:hypothetical protein [Salegentibacter holothuriorum]SKB70642.1 hypothetical protein SAMN05660776_2602 [Salegentibacter holothuriorum]
MNQNSQGYKPENDSQGQTIVVNPRQNNSNGTGTAGFVLALIALFLGWIPLLGWILWLLGLVLSFVGLFNKPNGLAIAGLIISLIGVALLIFLFAGLAIFGSLMSFN